jgi:hypothetical protein
MATTSFRFETDAASDQPMSEIRCPGCGDYLVVHMPDPEMPERLLGTCDGCKCWYVMSAGEGTMVLVATPALKGAARPRRAQASKRARIG